MLIVRHSRALTAAIVLSAALAALAMQKPVSANTTESASKTVDATTMTPADMDSIRAQIARNWDSDPDQPCAHAASVRIALAADGTVRQADGLDDFTKDQVCAAFQAGALRSVWLSSPLRLPAGRHWKTIVLVFDAPYHVSLPMRPASVEGSRD
jgi:hypothetical protein